MVGGDRLLFLSPPLGLSLQWHEDYKESFLLSPTCDSPACLGKLSLLTDSWALASETSGDTSGGHATETRPLSICCEAASSASLLDTLRGFADPLLFLGGSLFDHYSAATIITL